jgi:hypothetical protein
MGLFGKTRFLDPDVEDWCLETWGWLMTGLGGMERLRRTPLVAPTSEFFPPTAAEGHERALYLFGRVKSLMGVEEYPCALEVMRGFPGDQSGALLRLEGGQTAIAYASDLTDQPEALIATLARQLARQLVAEVRKPIPGGAEFRELAAELALAFAGFGLFGAMGAFRTGRPQGALAPGLAARREPRLSEADWAFGLALFATLKEIEVPTDRLQRHVAHMTRGACRYFGRNEPMIAALRAIA